MNKRNEILKNNRQLNYEILRIVAMLMIVCLHYLSKSGLLGNPSRANMTLTAYFAWFIEAFCLVAVNVYVLISGYFGAEKVFKAEEKTSWKIIQKPIIIWKQVLFYSVIIGMIALLAGIRQFDKYKFLSYIFPVVTEHYWFATSYILLCLLMPFLNEGIRQLGKKELGVLIIAMLTIFSVSKSVIPMQLPWDKYGYDVLWFIVVYLSGAYIKKYGMPLIDKRSKAVLIYVLSETIIFSSFIFFRLVFFKTGSFEDLINYGYTYNFIFCYTGAVGLFLAFGAFKADNANKISKTEKFRKPIELFSKATFGVYLIHEHIDMRGLWIRLVDSEKLLNASIGIFLINMIVTVLAVYLVCSLIEIVRLIFASWIWQKNIK